MEKEVVDSGAVDVDVFVVVAVVVAGDFHRTEKW